MSTAPSNWIWTSLPYDDTEPGFCYFRKTIELFRLPAQAICRITADSRYCFYVNGQLLSRGPCKGDGQVWFYDEVDLNPLLKKGENVLAAIVLRYPPSLGKGNRSVWRMEKPAFAIRAMPEERIDAFGKPQINAKENFRSVPNEDSKWNAEPKWNTDSTWNTEPKWNTDSTWNAEPKWNTDSTWKTYLPQHIRIHGDYPDTSRLYIQEEANGEPFLQGWLMPGYDDSKWADAVPYPGSIGFPAFSPGFQRPRPIPFLYETPCRFAGVFRLVESSFQQKDWDSLLQEDKALTLNPDSTEIVEIIAGRLTTGYPELSLAGGAGSRIEILQAESYSRPSGKPEGLYKKDRLDWQNGRLEGPMDIYRPGGYGTDEHPETYEPFWMRTFRFIRLRITTGGSPLTICRFTYRETGYPLDIQTKVSTSDATLADIWTISENSLRACMQETYIDCPFYEQLQYAMDSRSEMLYTYSISADDRLARQTLDDFARSQRADGLINACYPAYKPNVIPEFSIYYILMLHDHMMYFGDTTLIRRYLPVAERILDFFAGLIDGLGLVGRIPGTEMPGGCYWGFVDWAEGWPVGVPPASQCGPLTMDSLMFCLGLQKAADLADFLDRTHQAEEYRSMAESLKQAIREHCSSQNGLLQDGPGLAQYCQHVHVFAALTGTLTGQAARQGLLYTLEHPEIPQCSVAMGYYLFRALEITGLYEHTHTLWDKWRRMLSNHLTTCQESDGDYVRSDCHAWGALALYEMPSVILGIRPAKPGYASVCFSPVPGVLTYAEGQVITPKGMIKAGWNIENGEIKKHIILPEGLTIE